MDVAKLLNDYDLDHITVGALGGHSGLDVAHGANQFDFRTVIVAQQGRSSTYERYKHRENGSEYERGCIDELITVPKFQDILKEDVQKKLRSLNTIFVHNRYFWVYFDDFAKVENDFRVPIFGSRHLLKLEERDQKYNQYDLLHDAGIRTPKLFKKASDIDRLCIVKANEAKRSYERAFFIVQNEQEYEMIGAAMELTGKVTGNWRNAVIEEFIVGAPVNFNFFYSPITGELELLGTDTRRQTNLDGFLRMTAAVQEQVREHVLPSMVETGHIAVTVKESLLEKAYDLGEKFVKATQKLKKDIDPAQKGIIGPFALQGAVVAEDGKEDIVIFDVSLRIPGSPGTSATPYSGYMYGSSLSVGERIGLELKRAIEQEQLADVLS
jgi:5-formaminoimidazole-4-carboxamide-1-(beta)-D-ribofuranosyl 5'-monophosphate synthetase